MNTLRNITLVVGVLLLLPIMTKAENVSVKASITPTSIKIGEQATINLSSTNRASDKVIFPIISDTLGEGIEVVGITKRDTSELDGGMIEVKQQIIVTGFDSTLAQIKPFIFYHSGDSIQTQPLTLKITEIEVDTVKNDLRDIKDIYKAPINWGFVIRCILGMLIVCVLIFLIVRYIIKRIKLKEKGEIEPEVALDPYKEAKDKLRNIGIEKIWQKGEVKKYYTEVTDVMREYLKYRVGIEAKEMTSDEIKDSLRECDVIRNYVKIDEVIGKMDDVMKVSNIVKFAKYIPEFSENVRMLEYTETIIDYIERGKIKSEADEVARQAEKENIKRDEDDDKVEKGVDNECTIIDNKGGEL